VVAKAITLFYFFYDLFLDRSI